MTTKTYSELISIKDYRERFEYLALNGIVGDMTFGHNRYLNQALYHSQDWLTFRKKIIIRDDACDLAHPDYPIESYLKELEKKGISEFSKRGLKLNSIIIHHLNPLTQEQVINRDPCIFDPENVVCVSDLTHKAIHYGNANLLKEEWKPRTPNEIPWR